MNTILKSTLIRSYFLSLNRMHRWLAYRSSTFKPKRYKPIDPPRVHRVRMESGIQQRPAQDVKASIDQEQWLSQLAQADTLQSLASLASGAFSQSSRHLAQYLHHLYRHLSAQSLANHRTFFDQTDSNLNSFSASLAMTAQEYIQIMRFHCKYCALTNRIRFLQNFGFEKKASLIAANFLHKRQMTLSQAIIAYKMLASLGGVNILFYMNFIKYFKEISTGKAGQKIKIEQLLTLLSIKFVKRNEIIIENTLFDHVLSYLLANAAEMLQGEGLVMKVETLCTLMCIDCRNNYRSDSSIKKYWTSKLLREVTEQLDSQWVKEMLEEKPVEKEKVCANQVIYILQCITFAKRYMMEVQTLDQEFKNFANRANQLFQAECETGQITGRISEENLQKLMRFLFNPDIANHWISKQSTREKISKKMLSVEIVHQSTLRPLTNFLHCQSLSPQNKTKVLDLVKSILITRLLKKQTLTTLAMTFMQHCSSQTASALLKEKGFKPSSTSDFKAKLSFTFLQQLVKSKPLKEPLDLQPTQTGAFIRYLHYLAINSQSPKGYSIALSILEQHFDHIRNFLIQQDKSNANRSETNILLSEQSYLIAWIMFVNLANQNSIFQKGMHIFQRMMKNDLIKYEILTHFYQFSFPQPNQQTQLIKTNDDFSRTMTFLLTYFEQQDKYAYFMWDIFLKLYSTQTQAVREQSFPLLQQCFLRAYKKENLRKVIMTTVLTNFISTGVICGSRLKLQALFQQAIDGLMSAQEQIEYHFNCYLQIVSSAISADILAPIYFDKIMLHSLNKIKDMKYTCSLMLLYGASLKSRNQGGGIVEPRIINQQTYYLQYLIRNRLIGQERFSPKKETSKLTKKEVSLSSNLLSILFSFGIPDIISLQQQIYRFLQSHRDYAQWRCMANTYTAQNYSMSIRRQALFRGKVNQLMIDRLIYYMKLQLISKAEESYFIQKFK